MMHPDELEEMNYNRDDAEYRAVMIADNHDLMGDLEYSTPLSPEAHEAFMWELAAAEAARLAEADAEAENCPF